MRSIIPILGMNRERCQPAPEHFRRWLADFQGHRMNLFIKLSPLFMPLALLSLALTPDSKPVELLPPPQVEIAGLYEFTVEHEGEVIKGVVVIKAAKGGAYAMRWHSEAGGTIQGVGLREDGYLWVSWRDAQSFGLCRYKIEVEKDLPKLVGDRGTTEVLRGLK